MSLTKRFNLISKYMRVMLACFFGNYYHTYFRLTAWIISSKLLLMIDLCNKKKSCMRLSLEDIKELCRHSSKSHNLYHKMLRAVSSGSTWEHTVCIKPQYSIVGTGVARFLIRPSDLSFSFLQVLPPPSALRLFLALVYFTSLLHLYLLPSSPLHLPTHLSVLHTVLSAVIV